MKKNILSLFLILFVINTSYAQIEISLLSVKGKYDSYMDYTVFSYQKDVLDITNDIYRKIELASFTDEAWSNLLSSEQFLKIGNKKNPLFVENNYKSVGGHGRDYLKNENLFLPKTTLSKKSLKSIEFFKPGNDFNFSKENVFLIKIEDDPENILKPYLSKFQNFSGFYFAVSDFEKGLIIVPYGKVVGKPIILNLESSLKKFGAYVYSEEKEYGTNGRTKNAEFAFLRDAVASSILKSGKFLRINPQKLDLFASNTSYGSLPQNKLFNNELVLDKIKLKSIELFQPSNDFDFAQYNVIAIKIKDDPESILKPFLDGFTISDGYYLALNNFEKDLIIIPFNSTKIVNPNYSQFISLTKDKNVALTKPVKLTSFYLDVQAYNKLDFDEYYIDGLSAVIDSFEIDFRGVVDSFAIEVFNQIIITHHSKVYNLKIPLVVNSRWNYIQTPWIKENTFNYNDFISMINSYLPSGEKLPIHSGSSSDKNQCFSYNPYSELVQRFYNNKKEKEELAKKSKARKQVQEKEYEDLCAKYGKRYVDAALNGEIIVGMPEYLATFTINQFWSITRSTSSSQYITVWIQSKILSSTKMKVVVNSGKVTQVSNY